MVENERLDTWLYLTFLVGGVLDALSLIGLFWIGGTAFWVTMVLGIFLSLGACLVPWLFIIADFTVWLDKQFQPSQAE